MIKNPNSLQNDQIARIKKQLSQTLEENEKLMRDNQELMICWKDSIKIVKELQNTMNQEAKKMQEIMRLRRFNMV